MEGTVRGRECEGCKNVQSIVQTNEQMIQEQIKLIKNLHEDNLSLQQRCHHLELANTHLHQLLQQQRSLTAAETQTDFETAFLLPQDETSLKSTTRLNSTQPQKQRRMSLTVNKENLHELLPMVMIRKDESYFSRRRKNSYEEEAHAGQWLKAMEQLGAAGSHRFREKTASLARKVVPHELRHLVWPLAMDNHLAITDQLYLELLERRSAGWVAAEVRAQVEKDICRSFSGATQYEEKAGLRAEVGEVLELFHLYRPDVSYVQGMTYPVIVLTLVAGKAKAFRIFSNLVLANPFFRRLFTFEPNFVPAVARCFDLLLLEYSPHIAEKLRAQRVDSQIFLVEWFFTVFSRALSFEATLKFWDQLAYAGELALFRLALTIFDLIAPRIMDTNYEETLGLIQGFAGFTKEAKLLEGVMHHKLTAEKLHRSFDRVAKEAL